MEIGKHLLAGNLPEAFEIAQALLKRVAEGSDALEKVPVQLTKLAQEGIGNTSFALLGLRHGQRITPENPEAFDRALAHVQTLIRTGSAPVTRTALAYYLVILIQYFGEIVPEGSTEEFTLDMLRKAAAISDDFQSALEPTAGGAVKSVPQLQTCPNCHIRVLPSPDGICPSCRKPLSAASDAEINRGMLLYREAHQLIPSLTAALGLTYTGPMLTRSTESGLTMDCGCSDKSFRAVFSNGNVAVYLLNEFAGAPTSSVPVMTAQIPPELAALHACTSPPKATSPTPAKKPWWKFW